MKLRHLLLSVFFLVGAVFGSVPSSTTWVQYVLTTNPQTLTVPFVFQSASDLLVLDSKASPPVTLTLNSDYSVTGGAGSTGTISTIAGGANAVAIGDKITISRRVPLTQTTSFVTGGPLTPAMIGQTVDKLTTIAQQLNLVGANSLQFQGDEQLSGVLPLTSRKNAFLAFDANGVPWFPTTASIVGSVANPIVANSIASLRIVPTASLVNGAVCQVTGYYAANDGGGGVYVWNSTSTAADNGWSVIQPTGVATGRWMLQTSGPVNALQAGLRGDGATDNSSVLATLVGSTLAAGSSIVFPAGSGTFVVGNNVNIPVGISVVFGSGAKISVASGKTVEFDGPFSCGRTQCFGGLGSVAFGAGSISAAFPEWWGAVPDGATNSTAALNASVSAFHAVSLADGIYMTDGWLVNTMSAFIWGTGSGPTGKPGVRGTCIKARGSQTYVLRVIGHDNVFRGITFNGDSQATYAADLAVPSLHNVFSHCVFERVVPGTGGLGGTLVNIDSGSPSIQGDSNVIVDCTLMQNYTNSDKCAIGVNLAGSNAFLNVIDRCQISGVRIGVQVVGGGGTVRSCNFSGQTLACVYVSSGCQALTIDSCYTETGVAFFTMGSFVAVQIPPIVLRNNYLNAFGASINLMPLAPILLENNDVATNIYVDNPTAYSATYPFIVSIGNSFSSSTYIGPKYTSVLRFGDVETSGTDFKALGVGNQSILGGRTQVSAVIDPPSIANGGSYTVLVGATGAQFLDAVMVNAPYDLQGLGASAAVSAGGQIRLTLVNNTGGAIDLASATWYFTIFHQTPQY